MGNIVIGAGSGMGAAIARKIAPLGPLVLADCSTVGLESLAAELGTDTRTMPCDITDADQVERLFEAVDGLDALIVTAGVSSSQAAGHRILEVNLVGVAQVLAIAEPFLRPGSVGICFASQSGYMVPDVPEMFAVLDDPLAPGMIDRLADFYDVDLPGLSYQMSKRGLHRLVRQLALPWGRRGARILSVSPGINDTPMNRADEARNPIMADIIAASPLGRRGTPEEIAKVVAFLISEDASYMTGSDVLVDGGMVTVLPRSPWTGKIRTRAAA